MMFMKKETAATETKKRYLAALFQMLKRREGLTVADGKSSYNDTELRLICEVFAAKSEGRRLISTQLAKLLGVTRSAVSQIVNRLEEREIVKRVADSIDRKIAYIEITENALQSYSEDMERVLDFVGALVEEYGEEKFYMLCSLFEEFTELAEKRKAEALR
ncbi:MAG: MarR family transcriptional regulator [Clostridiales bacterium]|nr:MarR family transcriptional regulator [Clostridiales bacterium]